METQRALAYVSDEVITELNIADSEIESRSWNLFAILLAIGRPVLPIELASRCTSLEVSQSFIEFVCSVPNSPLSLTNDGLVTVSSAFCRILQRFLSSSNNLLSIVLPREINARDLSQKRGRGDLEIIYHPKRRRLWPYFSENADSTDLVTPDRFPNACAKVHIHVEDDSVRSVIMNTGNLPVGMPNDNGPFEVTLKMSSHINLDAGFLNYGLNNSKHEVERKATTSLSMKELGSKDSFSSYGSYTSFPGPWTNISRGIKDHFQFHSSHLTPSSLVEGREYDNNKVISLVKDWIDNGSSRANSNFFEVQRLVEGREYDHTLNPVSHEGNVESLLNGPVHGGMIPELSFVNMNSLSCNDMAHCSTSVERSPCQEVGKLNIISPTGAEKLCMTEAHMDDLQDKERADCGREEQIVCSQDGEPYIDNLSMSMNMTCKDRTRRNSVRNKHTSTGAELNLISTRALNSDNQDHLLKSTAKLEVVRRDPDIEVERVSVATNNGDELAANIDQKNGKKDKRPVALKQKLKPTCDQKMHATGKQENIKETKEKATTNSVKDHLEPKVLPMFDSFTVEEEEGSGGYGTVYKACRKKDGITFAVKYPHVNANRHHVYNELKMLERFGGKNFVIKYEGSFKSGNSHCLVLEHVVHDRPEVLKREIDVYELRWYGYCLFKALASLHKQGVVHRDVKPGNFLFSRKTSKGYLIDFNLAIDLHQKLGSTEKSKSHLEASLRSVSPSRPESLPPVKGRKYTTSKALEAVKQEAGTRSKSLLFPTNLKRKTDQVKDRKDLNIDSLKKSQGADGSGITSTKDATSTRVPSAERFREPILYKGRKEYLNLVHEAMQSPDQDATSTPTFRRKRVAAPLAKLDKFIYLTPMPLQSSGMAVPGAGLHKNKGEGKQRKEGPCVGTKGFRAPEVLFRSTYQGPKVDVWSAGVTLLYLIIGRSPFVGEPDQNIKEIAMLRGSEDLWEVAKLHDRESSFPLELFQVQSLPSTKLQQWCKHNTRRPGFLEAIPRSLIDLVDKCLTVNPRLRISAEDALRHEFFMPCFKELEKQRQQRLGLNSGSTQPMTIEGRS